MHQGKDTETTQQQHAARMCTHGVADSLCLPLTYSSSAFPFPPFPFQPNKFKRAIEFDGVMVIEQLRYSGVFEAITIRKQGFPFRLTHENFMKRFKCIMPKKTWPNHKQACTELIQAMGMDLQAVQMGVTKVLYRAKEHGAMELKRNVNTHTTHAHPNSHAHVCAWPAQFGCMLIVAPLSFFVPPCLFRLPSRPL